MLLADAGISQALWAIAALVIGPIACVLMLRAARFPLQTLTGRAIIAGTLAGLVLGPTILGRFMPDQFEAIAVGGIEERQALEYARWFNANVPQALKSMTDEARAAQRAEGEREVAAKQQQLDAARWQHQRPLRVLTMFVAALALLASARQSIRGRERDKRQGWITPLSVGLWSFALPGGLACAIAMRWWDSEISEAAMLAATVGIGPWALGGIDREASDGAEFGGARMMQTAGRIASMVAIIAAMWAAWNGRGMDGLLYVSPLLALPLAWLIDLAPLGSIAAPRQPRAIESIAVESVLAVLAALVTMRVDLHAHLVFAAIGLLLVLGLLACDGRWLGAFIGAMLPGGRPAMRTMRLAIPAMACGPTQLAAAALALHGGMLPDRFVLPLLAGVLVIEITAPARRHMAAQLIATEAEIDDEN